MKKIIAIAVLLIMIVATSTAIACDPKAYQNGELVTNWAEIIEHETIYIDIGDINSESQVTMNDWAKIWTPTGSGWGGFVGNLRTIYGPESLTLTASITLDEEYPIESIYIHHLDGQADDGFNLYIDGVLKWTYTDNGLGTETWQDNTIDINSYGTILTFEITGSLWPLAHIYGQVCIDEVVITGYDTEDPYGQGDLVRIVWE